MSEVQAVAATLVSLKTAADMLKAFIDVRGAIQEQGKVFELQRVILSAHQSALDAQEAQTTLLTRIGELEKKIADFETWDREKDRYELKNVGVRGPVLVYAIKESAQGGEPFHLLCPKCYQHRLKSPLQATTEVKIGLRVHLCPECKTEFAFSIVREPPTRTLPKFDPFSEA
jgi:hypothetical protein